MTIKRIFKVTIEPDKRTEFEKDFSSISVSAINGKEGFLSLEIGRPTKWNPNDYVMISNWKDEEALITFVGEDWNKAVIPKQMEQYVVSCSVEHYHIDSE